MVFGFRTLGDEASRSTGEFHVVKFVSQENAEEVNRTGEKQVRFCGEHIRCLAAGNTKGIFEGVD